MRRLTFKGFLDDYVAELSFSGTSSVIKLLKELEQNPRLKEPLILHSIFSGLPCSVSDRYPAFFEEYRYLLDLLQNKELEQIVKTELPYKYQKIFSAYEYRLNRVANENESKLLMRKRIISIQEEKGITNYRIYTDLKMNPGNVNSFLKNGVPEKISLASAREIWCYVKEY